jgi:hypothetical protein
MKGATMEVDYTKLYRECLDTNGHLRQVLADIEARAERAEEALAAAEAECAEWRQMTEWVPSQKYVWSERKDYVPHEVFSAIANDATRARLGMGRIGEAR